MDSKLQPRCIKVKNSKRNARIFVNVSSFEEKKKHDRGEGDPKFTSVKSGCICKFTIKSREGVHFVSVRGTDWELLWDQWATDSTRLKFFSDGSVDDYDSGRLVQRELRHKRSQCADAGVSWPGRKPSLPAHTTNFGRPQKVQDVSSHGQARDSMSSSDLSKQSDNRRRESPEEPCAGGGVAWPGRKPSIPVHTNFGRTRKDVSPHDSLSSSDLSTLEDKEMELRAPPPTPQDVSPHGQATIDSLSSSDFSSSVDKETEIRAPPPTPQADKEREIIAPPPTPRADKEREIRAPPSTPQADKEKEIRAPPPTPQWDSRRRESPEELVNAALAVGYRDRFPERPEPGYRRWLSRDALADQWKETRAPPTTPQKRTRSFKFMVNSPRELRQGRSRRFAIFPAWGPVFNGVFTSVSGTHMMRNLGMPTLQLQYTMKMKSRGQKQCVEAWYMNQAILHISVAAVRLKFNRQEFYALVFQHPRDRDLAEALILYDCSSSNVKDSLAPIAMTPEQVKIGDTFEMVLLGIVRDFQDEQSAVAEDIYGKISKDIKKMGHLLASLSPGGWRRPLSLWNVV